MRRRKQTVSLTKPTSGRASPAAARAVRQAGQQFAAAVARQSEIDAVVEPLHQALDRNGFADLMRQAFQRRAP